jgi:hypothetical protein
MTMALQILNNSEKIFPSLSKTVVDSKGIRLEWTEEGSAIIMDLIARSPLFDMFGGVTPFRKTSYVINNKS